MLAHKIQIRDFFKHIYHKLKIGKLFVIFLGMGLLFFQSPALAVVNTCQSLTMYGNAVNEGLCKSLSPATQNLWVCALADGNPDVHTTFNATNSLHITVRLPNDPNTRAIREGNSTLDGTFPGHISIAAGQPRKIQGVDVENYVSRLNQVQQMPAAGGLTVCQTPFNAAMTPNGAMHSKLQRGAEGGDGYMALCRNNNCP